MALSEEAVRQWDLTGAVNVPVPGLADCPELLARVRAEMTLGMPWHSQLGTDGWIAVKHKGRRSNTNNWVDWGPSLAEVVQLPFFEEAAKSAPTHPTPPAVATPTLTRRECGSQAVPPRREGSLLRGCSGGLLPRRRPPP